MAEFDILSQAYDAMINWDRRLANEVPLFRWLFEQVAPVACLMPPVALAGTRPCLHRGACVCRGLT